MTRPALISLRLLASRFRRDEEGGMVIFCLFLFFLMLIMMGLSIDFMRHERLRTAVQNATDRAVLAAAAVDETRPPNVVIDEYLQLQGFKPGQYSVGVGSAVGSRQVRVTTRLPMDTYFLRLVGQRNLPVSVGTSAAEAVPNTEVALVLDASSSMKGSRITNLRTAATTFVNTVMPAEAQDPAEGLTTISIVPYSMSVNVGRDLLDEFNMTRIHNRSNCVMFDNEDFDRTELDPAQQLDQFYHFNHSNGSDEDHPGYSNSLKREKQTLCPRAEASPGVVGDGVNVVLPWQTTRGPLLASITALDPQGATGIDTAFKWGLALLDPSTQDARDGVEADGLTTSDTAGFPLPYNLENTSKVLVMMTDGNLDGTRNVRQQIRDEVWSNVFYDPDTNRHSLLLRGDKAIRIATSNQNDNLSDKWYHFDRSGWTLRNYPDTAEGGNWDWDKSNNGSTDTANQVYNGLERLTHVELFNRFGLSQIKGKVYQKPRNKGWLHNREWNIYKDLRVDQHETDPNNQMSMDADAEATWRVEKLCDLAASKGVAVYTIAMNAPSQASKDLMANCASDPTYYFDVNEGNIEETFKTIALSIEELRLTQ
ncbi:MAG: Tad domain-containing protein [Pseudomonadota bacterium]